MDWIVLHLLGGLIAVKSEASGCAFHDDSWAETTEYTGLVVFCRVELRLSGIIRIIKLGGAGWALPLYTIGTRQASCIGALKTEDVAASGDHST